ncbi:hypothetical protein WDU94_003013, partial [Cyamophila willieti]
SNISLILHAVGEYELSLRFLEKALALNVQYYGSKSLKVAVSYHLVARTQSCMGDFRSALQNEKETYAIYKQQLGEEHEKTRESSDCLRHLTHQAVVLQKKMNEIYSGRGSTGLPPIQIQPPSMGSVLDMLNVINGVLFVQISQIDIENFKAEMEKRASVLDNNNSTPSPSTSTPPLNTSTCNHSSTEVTTAQQNGHAPGEDSTSSNKALPSIIPTTTTTTTDSTSSSGNDPSSTSTISSSSSLTGKPNSGDGGGNAGQPAKISSCSQNGSSVS